MPFILGTNSIKDTGYDVANSLRFNDGSSDALIRTLDDPGGAGNRNKWTFSTWLKRGTLGTTQWIFGSYQNSNYYTYIRFKNDKLDFADLYNGSFNGRRETNRVFRDPSAWLHLVFIWDKDNSTTSEKMRIYVNGVEETSFATSSAPSNATTLNADGQDISIGQQEGIGTYFDGYLCETVFNDGQAYTADNYGEFDSDSPNIWKPIDVSGLTFGTNGFYLDFENASSLGADVSGNSNNFTVNNLTSVDQSTDTCTNNFATLNPLASGVAIGGSAGTFTDGNLFFSGASSAWCATKGTFSVTQGKWYMEAKKTTNANGTSNGQGAVAVGFAELQSNLGNDNPQNDSDVYSSILVINDNGWTTNFANGTQWSTPLAVNDGDIVGIALDLDGNNYTFYVNGSQVDTGSLGGSYDGNGLTPCVINYGGDTREFTCNFGSPSFTISSGNSDANGYGNFEYSVPSGYYALNTKNLAEYG